MVRSIIALSCCFLKSRFVNTGWLAFCLSLSCIIIKIKSVGKVHKLCCKNLEESDVQRLINARAIIKKKLNSEDIVKFLVARVSIK